MRELNQVEQMSVCGGEKLACVMWWVTWGAVAGTAIIGGGPIGYFGVALAIRGALSENSPC